ncbi:MAG: phycobilisome linker polypeptide [Synechococcaceae cyanobacterium]|nr:phycobilisome linker polypeptide [Synechococcaceae cyanobacterium]
MKVSAGTRGTGTVSGRQVSITVTGIANNDFVRSANAVMQVPYTRMNETLRLVHRLGGRVTDVSVSGGDLSGQPRRKATAKNEG